VAAGESAEHKRQGHRHHDQNDAAGFGDDAGRDRCRHAKRLRGHLKCDCLRGQTEADGVRQSVPDGNGSDAYQGIRCQSLWEIAGRRQGLGRCRKSIEATRGRGRSTQSLGENPRGRAQECPRRSGRTLKAAFRRGKRKGAGGGSVSTGNLATEVQRAAARRAGRAEEVAGGTQAAELVSGSLPDEECVQPGNVDAETRAREARQFEPDRTQVNRRPAVDSDCDRDGPRLACEEAEGGTQRKGQDFSAMSYHAVIAPASEVEVVSRLKRAQTRNLRTSGAHREAFARSAARDPPGDHP